MASQLQIPSQNLNIDIPDVVFRGVPGNAPNQAFVRSGTDLLTISRADYESSTGKSFETLPSQNPSSEGLHLLQRAGGKLVQASPQQFASVIPQPETITQKISSVNPQGIDVISSLSGTLKTAPSLQQQAQKFGVTGEQLRLQQSSLLPTGKFAPGIPQQIPKEPVILSSLGGQKQVASTQQNLTNIQQLLERGRLLGQQAAQQIGKQTGQQIGVPSQDTLTNISTSSSTGKMVADINKAAQGGQVSPDVLTNLKEKEANALAALSNAQSSSDTKDFRNMDFWYNRYQEEKKDWENQLQTYFTDVKNIREGLMKTLQPSAKEQELNKQLVDLRGNIEQFQLETQKKQISEFEAQTVGFAAGRGRDIEFQRSFKLQEMALKEKNLLLELGLEKEAREYEGKVLKEQLGFFKDDFDLRNKIEDKITQQEEKLFDRMRGLESDAKNSLFKFIDNLEGVDPDKMSSESASKLSELAQQANLDISLVNEALKTQYNRTVFEQSQKIETGKREQQRIDIAEEKEKKVEDEKKVEFSNSQISSGAATAGLPIADFQKLDTDTQNFFINNDDIVKTRKKEIDNAKIAKEDPSSIEKEISESNLPSAVKDTLVKYLWTRFSRPQQNEGTPWWRRLF